LGEKIDFLKNFSGIPGNTAGHLYFANKIISGEDIMARCQARPLLPNYSLF
jgi:hypothetical protein